MPCHIRYKIRKARTEFLWQIGYREIASILITLVSWKSLCCVSAAKTFWIMNHVACKISWERWATVSPWFHSRSCCDKLRGNFPVPSSLTHQEVFRFCSARHCRNSAHTTYFHETVATSLCRWIIHLSIGHIRLFRFLFHGHQAVKDDVTPLSTSMYEVQPLFVCKKWVLFV